MNILKESWTNLKRHNLLTFATIISLGLILVVFNVLISHHFKAKAFINELSEKISYTIYLKSDTEAEEISKIQQYLENQPEVESVNFYSKDDALDNLEQKTPSSVQFLETYELKNPLPNSFKIKTTNLEDHSIIQSRIQNSAFKDDLLKTKLEKEHSDTIQKVIQNLIQIKNTSLNAFLGILAIFILAGSLITFNAIKTSLYNRKNEIQIMQLVGATLSRIRSPFLLESVLIAMLSFLVNLLFLIPISQLFLTSFQTQHNFSILFYQLLAALIISFFTSLALVNKHLRSKEIYQD
jgi:cell division transport system permease protein